MWWELVLNLEAEYMPYLWHIGSSPSCVATSNACTYPLGKACARIFISFIVHHLNVTERVDKLWYVYGMQYSALFGMAKKFIWVSYNIVWKNPNTLLGQSNTCHNVNMLYRVKEVRQAQHYLCDSNYIKFIDRTHLFYCKWK